MTDEWHPNPERDDSTDEIPADQGHQPMPPAASSGHEDTRVLPPQQSQLHDTEARPRRRTTLSAAVLAGALVLGVGGGVGGAAIFDSQDGSQSGDTTSQSATSDITSSASSSSPASSNASDTTIETVAATVLPSVVQINVRGQNEAGTGSGIVLTQDGTILTNNHVVAVAGNSGRITVNFNDGSSAPAKIVGTDPVTDIAVIKAQNVSGLNPAEIGKSSALKVGQGVVAIGSPFGLGATVTSGIVSALQRPVSVSEGGGQSSPFGLQQQQASQSTTYPAIQTDAAINPGNSGGPLVNLSGQVIGIDSAIHTDTSGSSGQGGSIGLGFAIPIDEVLPIINQLRHGETPTHARLGVTVSDNTTSRSANTGALVKSVQSGAAADKAGLKPGDVITKVDGQVIAGSDALVATVRGHRPGDSVTMSVLRGGNAQTIKAKLGSDVKSATS